jgi:DNA/RNA-binding domain of Phe-tRNA-synthetase-like protein
MNYDITDIISDYPHVHIGVLIGEKMDNTNKISEIRRLQKQAIHCAKAQIGDQPPIKHPHIHSWRELYRSFGTKAGDYRPSAEALIRRCIKEGEIPRINNAVDLYNLVSVKYIIPMGGFDLDHIKGDIRLRYSSGGEVFVPLGSGNEEETYEGEVVYADDERILTRRWNFRDADATKITQETTSLVMFLDASPAISLEKVESALHELRKLYKRYCGGEYSTFIVGKENPVVEIWD